MKFFKKIKDFADLKKQYRDFLKVNHPDNGGDVETMKEINIEYAALFPIWREKAESESGEKIQETAESTRKQFYTAFGWEGIRHDWNRDIKEVAQIVRTYIKKKYPDYKFGVRISRASMCQELHVEMKESPIEIYKKFEEMTPQDFLEVSKRIYRWSLEDRMVFLEASPEEKRKILESSTDSYKNLLNEKTEEVVRDIDDFVKSYNYHDCDGSIDYFDVDFYYFGCLPGNGKDVKIVPPKLKKSKKNPNKSTKNGYTYRITKGEDTRDGSELWIVRIAETLDRSAYIAESKAMQERGGYYSKFKHGFIFRFDPSKILS